METPGQLSVEINILIIRRPLVLRLRRAFRQSITTRRFSIDIFELIAIASAFLTTTIFGFAYFSPLAASDLAPRAIIVPLIFGSAVFLATFLAWIGDLVGLPILFSCVLLSFAVTALNTHFNDIREFKKLSPHFSDRQIDLDAAVAKWKEANGCDNSRCPPALIIAAEGGASRAAFAAATAVGFLLDHADSLLDRDKRSPARRIFLISGVSGGAFGAAVIRTALWEAQGPKGGNPPCKIAPRTLFTQGEDVKTSWKVCLQALVSGDYLTPAFVGLGFRDNLSPPPIPGLKSTLVPDDRAALVEQAWEHHFDDVTMGRDPDPVPRALYDLTQKTEDETGLRGRFGYMSDQLKDGLWIPLLALNSTSVNTGARIVVSDLVSTRAVVSADPKDNPSREALYPAAFDLFEMLSTPCPAGEIEGDACNLAHDGARDASRVRDGADIRMSTAAMLSARFPIVSPAGIIRTKTNAAYGDRGVDGGYFENAGLTTALDIARALRSRGLTPIVLWVQNDPSSANGDPAGSESPSFFPPRAANSPKLRFADAAGLETVFGVIATPFNALTATRNGHSMEEDSAIEQYLESLNVNVPPGEEGPNFFTFKAYKFPNFQSANDEALPYQCKALLGDKNAKMEMSEVSMSWWLSQAVQAEVDSQICDYRNRSSLDQLMKRLSQRLTIRK